MAKSQATLLLYDRDKALKRAFKEMNLDPKRLLDWKILADRLACLHYGQPGRRIVWDIWRLKELWDDANELLMDDPGMSDVDRCRELRTNEPTRKKWRSYSNDFLRKKLRQANTRIIDDGELEEEKLAWQRPAKAGSKRSNATK
jgi:hypothetical protein